MDLIGIFILPSTEIIPEKCCQYIFSKFVSVDIKVISETYVAFQRWWNYR